MSLDLIFSIIVLVMSVVVHEVSHGYMANALGDPTARLAGRLTLNPIKHLDPIGSILVPIITSLGGFTFGWAKPVPYNPYNLRNPKSGELLIALAGPLSNAIIAIFFGLVIRFGIQGNLLTVAFLKISASIVIVNLVLTIFNLVPIPPLDGSKILFGLLPDHLQTIRARLEQFSMILVLVFVFFVWQFVSPFIYYLFSIITGI